VSGQSQFSPQLMADATEDPRILAPGIHAPARRFPEFL
jgi:hypothetical protein